MTIQSSKPQDDQNKDSKSLYFDRPALDVSVAFPQATPASIFPPCTSDYYQFADLLTPEEQALRLKVRECVERDVAPIMTKYWEKAGFPFEIVPKLGALNIAGGTIKDYGCPGLSVTASALATAELARVDASCSTFILVHSSLAMLTISLCGSEIQKQKYFPSLAKLDTIACWGLTEPDYGSDASGLRTTATKVEGGWVIEGQKRWIGNSTFADVENNIHCKEECTWITKIENKIVWFKMVIFSCKKFLSLMKTGYLGSTLFKILARCLRFPVSWLPGNLLASRWVSTTCAIDTYKRESSLGPLWQHSK